MSNNSTTARPYAKAAFEYAQSNKNFDAWTDGLANLSAIALDPAAAGLFSNPKVSREQRADVFAGALGEKADAGLVNFVRLLASNDRLAALPEINEQFAILRAEVESVLEGTVICAKAIDSKQEAAIAAALSKRLDKTVKLQSEVDESLIGGVKIKVGDFVIDGSVKARLEKMAGALAN